MRPGSHVTYLLRTWFSCYVCPLQVTAAYVVCFSPDGQHILGGYNKSIAVFDTSRPGREYKKVNTHVKKKDHNLPGRQKGQDLGCFCLSFA